MTFMMKIKKLLRHVETMKMLMSPTTRRKRRETEAKERRDKSADKARKPLAASGGKG